MHVHVDACTRGCMYTWMHVHWNGRPSLPAAGAHRSHANDQDVLSQHVLQGTVHSFNHSITFWVVWRGSGLVHVEQYTYFLEQLGFEVSSRVRVDSFWCSIPGNDFFHPQLLCYGLCFLVWNSKHLFPFREVISDNQDVLVPMMSSAILSNG